MINYDKEARVGFRLLLCIIFRNINMSSEGRQLSPSPRCSRETKIAVITMDKAPLPSNTFSITPLRATHCQENTNKLSLTVYPNCSPAQNQEPGQILRSSDGDWRQSGAGCQSSPTRSWPCWFPPCSRSSAPPSSTSCPHSCLSITPASTTCVPRAAQTRCPYSRLPSASPSSRSFLPLTSPRPPESAPLGGTSPSLPRSGKHFAGELRLNFCFL